MIDFQSLSYTIHGSGSLGYQRYVLSGLGSDLGAAVSSDFVFNGSLAQMFKASSLGNLRSAMAYFAFFGDSRTDTNRDVAATTSEAAIQATGKHRAGSNGAAICQQSIVSRTFSR